MEAINSRELVALGGPEHKFVAQDSDPQMTTTLDARCLAGQVVTLKVGAQVNNFVYTVHDIWMGNMG